MEMLNCKDGRNSSRAASAQGRVLPAQMCRPAQACPTVHIEPVLSATHSMLTGVPAAAPTSGRFDSRIQTAERCSPISGQSGWLLIVERRHSETDAPVSVHALQPATCTSSEHTEGVLKSATHPRYFTPARIGLFL